jgi:histidine triad (HIT) family protein
MKDCLFCDIVSGDIPTKKVYEDDSTLAFLDIEPLTKGHTLVVPKKHSSTIIELPDTEINPLFSTVKKITAMLGKALEPQGFTIGINHGRISGQSIDHLHIHIIPRFTGDGGGSIHSAFHTKLEYNLEEVIQKILNTNK